MPVSLKKKLVDGIVNAVLDGIGLKDTIKGTRKPKTSNAKKTKPKSTTAKTVKTKPVAKAKPAAKPTAKAKPAARKPALKK